MAADIPAIRVDHVSKSFRRYKDRPGSLKEMITKFRMERYENFRAVDDVSLQVEHGEVYGLVGHNGSGKSTLLKMMANIHRPTSGTITTDGRISALLELGAGFHPDLTGRENVYLNASILGLHRREVDLLLDDIVDFSGLSAFIDSPVRHYSSGMFVRLGFAVAVHVNPQILIVDEIIAVGDEEFQRRCFEHLYKLRNNGVTIVMVTHSLEIVRTMCDRAAWLDHGHLMSEGRSVDVVRDYLAQVNDAESERQFELDRERALVEQEARLRESPVGEPAERLVTLGEIELVDHNGRETRYLETHRSAVIRVNFSCRRPVQRPKFSFSIETQAGVLASNQGTTPDHGAQPEYSGDGSIEFVMPSVILGPGEYTLSVAVHDSDGTMVVDKKERVITFRVGTDLPFTGVTDLLGSWSDPQFGGSR
jgi:ABC-2 type transport system ATP-binding protein/lipopolysaccharide transport system ATP-binding protein